jgi:hypothetical protein
MKYFFLKNFLFKLLITLTFLGGSCSLFAIEGVKLIGFQSKQEEQISILFTKIKALKPAKLVIPKELYLENSRFKALFGFEFNGNQLAIWIKDRIQTIEYGKLWTVAVNKGNKIVLGDKFLASNFLEQSYILVHEARHADASCPSHIKCPAYFPFLSAGQPEMPLANKAGCDGSLHGAYAYQAAFLFELSAYGLVDQTLATHYYNASISRLLPVWSKTGKTENFQYAENTKEYQRQQSIVQKLNQFSNFTFDKMWNTVEASSYHNVKVSNGAQRRYTIIFYTSHDTARMRYKALIESGTPAAMIGSIIILVPGFDRDRLIEKLKQILIGEGFQIG